MMLGVKGVDSISSNRLLTESGGPLLVRPPIGCCAGRWEDRSMMTGAVEGLGYASWAIASYDFPIMLGV